MYLTDYRERCLKDVITQLEPGLFKKVTGLSVEDFNMLCSLGVFNAPLMNDAIFKFKRYEDASLTYTGLNKHADDEVGGWDTTIRKTEYEKLFYNQQASMSDIDSAVYSKVVEPVDVKREERKRAEAGELKKVRQYTVAEPVQSVQTEQSKDMSSPLGENERGLLLEKLESLGVDSIVLHKKFGRGVVVKMDRNAKFIHIKFTLGEKKFVFPNAFLMGFLEVG